jgi:hypothetical protein
MDRSSASYGLVSKPKDDLFIPRSLSPAISKDVSPLKKLSEWKSKLFISNYRSFSKKVGMKKVRFDYENYFNPKKSPKIQKAPEKLLTISKENFVSSKIRQSPARFCSIQRSGEARRKTPDQTLDLLLLKEINLQNSNKKLDLEKFYFEKFVNSQSPTNYESQVDRFFVSQKKKHVTFCL